MDVSVVWFRRDLRVNDHPALLDAVASGDAVAPLFVVDDALVGGRWRSRNRLWFMHASVTALARDLEALGAPLSIVRGRPADVVPAFAAAADARRVIVSRDLLPYGRRRDARVASRLGEINVAFDATPGVLIHEPEAISTAAGTPFRVYGPFRRLWLRTPRRAALPAPDRLRSADVPATPGIEAVLPRPTPTADPASMAEPGEAAAQARLEHWASGDGIERYASDRNRLDHDGTSRLSQDLRCGLLSPVEVAERCEGPGDGRSRFINELAWRDFYAHLLWHEPRALRHAYLPAFERVARTDDPPVIDAWRDGRTGYPVVDAAMRQLHETGWMHNRARMIAASFLTKHLGVDWRIGEAHFMEHLVDGDPASNSGGWQWAASIGTDPQPWFRVFNPTRQGIRHDPDGDWVRRWLPELAAIAGPAAHEPPAGAYLPRIVDAAMGRESALAAYREARDRGRDGVPSKA